MSRVKMRVCDGCEKALTPTEGQVVTGRAASRRGAGKFLADLCERCSKRVDGKLVELLHTAANGASSSSSSPAPARPAPAAAR